MGVLEVDENDGVVKLRFSAAVERVKDRLAEALRTAGVERLLDDVYAEQDAQRRASYVDALEREEAKLREVTKRFAVEVEAGTREYSKLDDYALRNWGRNLRLRREQLEREEARANAQRRREKGRS